MAEILLDEQGPPAAPASGKSIIYPDSVSSKLTFKDDSGRGHTMGGQIRNFSTALQTGFASDTYLVGSNLVVPGHGLQAGTLFEWRFDVTKTGAGTAGPTFNIRVGTAGTTSDASRCLFTGSAQTAVADTGFVQINATLRNTGAAGVIAGVYGLSHNVVGGITGLSVNESNIVVTVGGSFDTTTANLIVGLSINGGGSAAWTIQQVQAEMLNI